MSKITFAPSVVVDGQTYMPPGWLWIASFAAAGCDWAQKELSNPSVKKQMDDFIKERKRLRLTESLVYVRQEAASLKQREADLLAELQALDAS